MDIFNSYYCIQPIMIEVESQSDGGCLKFCSINWCEVLLTKWLEAIPCHLSYLARDRTRTTTKHYVCIITGREIIYFSYLVEATLKYNYKDINSPRHVYITKEFFSSTALMGNLLFHNWMLFFRFLYNTVTLYCSTADRVLFVKLEKTVHLIYG